MHSGFQFLSIFLLEVVGGLVSAEDIPCIAREESAGYICVCNETYCDTVEPPSPLPQGSYYHYMTSDISPGFTKTIRRFTGTLMEQQFNNISSDVFIWLNTSVKYQTFTGVGASITDSSAMMFNSLSSGAKQMFVESFFGELGLEYTLTRVPIGCSDFSQRPYTYDDVPGDVELKYFNLTEEDLLLKIPFIQMAMNASQRGLNLIATPWTSPFWMKTNNDYSPGYIYNQYYGTYTNYILKFFEAYSNYGIEFWGLTQGNEVTIPLFFGPGFMIPNVVMLPAQSREWTKTYLGPMLKASKYRNIKLLTLDDERPFMPWWSSRMFSDKEAAHYIDGIALHWYFDSNKTVPELEEFHNTFPEKFIIYTESSINTFQSGGGPVSLGDWSRAVRYINNIFQNLGHWVIGYVDWNIALNEEGGPTGPANISLDASVIVNTTNGEFYKQPFFYVLGHFSKFIYPGSNRIGVTIKQDSLDSYYDEDNSHEAFTNEIKRKMAKIHEDPTTPSPFPTRKPDPPSNTVLVLATTNPNGSRTVITYNPRAEPANLIVTDPQVGTFNQTVDPHSLNTFIYWTNN